MNNLTKILKIVGHIIAFIIAFWLLQKIDFAKYTTVPSLLLIGLVGAIIVFTVLAILQQQKRYLYFAMLFYLGLLVCLLFLRTPDDASHYTTGTYFFGWLKILYHNEIVFVNIIGNVVLMIPLGFYSNVIIPRKVLLSGALFIIGIESLQYFLKVGIFDYIDIILNYIGFILGIIFSKFHWKDDKHGKKEEASENPGRA